MKVRNLDYDGEFFFGSRYNEKIVTMRYEGNVILLPTILSAKEEIFEYLDLIARTDAVKVVVIRGEGEKDQRKELVEFYQSCMEPKFDDTSLLRMFRGCDQYILRLVKLNKFVIYVDSNDLIFQSLNVSLAGDYRIVSDDTTYHNPSIELGLMAKGGGVFFLTKLLGRSKTFQILLTQKTLRAKEALELGIVDQVVSSDKLEDVAIETACQFARYPTSSIIGIKKLINYSIQDLEDYLHFERSKLMNIIGRGLVRNLCDQEA